MNDSDVIDPRKPATAEEIEHDGAAVVIDAAVLSKMDEAVGMWPYVFRTREDVIKLAVTELLGESTGVKMDGDIFAGDIRISVGLNDVCVNTIDALNKIESGRDREEFVRDAVTYYLSFVIADRRQIVAKMNARSRERQIVNMPRGDIRSIETRTKDGKELGTNVRMSIELGEMIGDSMAEDIQGKFNRLFNEIEDMF